jgi:hypothetical protein
VKDLQDGNAGSLLRISELVENWRNGKRQLASEAYDLYHVRVLTNTIVRRHVHGMYRCEPGGQSVFNRELPRTRYIYLSL